MLFRSKTLLAISVLAIFAGIFAKTYIDRRYEPAVSGTAETAPEATPSPRAPQPGNTATSSPAQAPLPATALLSVPFTPQAPTANWEGIFKEACEEASALMAAEYFAGNREPELDAAYATREIQRLADWEQERFGYNLDINNEETREMIEQVYGLKTSSISNFTEEDIKQELAQGRLVLLPADGRKLNNPNFRRPGPPYHMLVIRGYNSQGFVTNDPGTKRGMNYSYSFDTLYEATGEWDHGTDSVDTAIKEAIVVWKG